MVASFHPNIENAQRDTILKNKMPTYKQDGLCTPAKFAKIGGR